MKNYLLLLFCFILLGPLFSCRHPAKNESTNAAQVDSTLNAINKSISDNPKDPALYVKRADYFVSLERMNDALADATKALELDPKNKQASISLSTIYVMVGKPQQSLDVLNNLIAVDPAFTEAYLKKAKLCLVMKDYEKCAEAVQKVFELDPYNADAYYLKGVALDENKESTKAVEAFQKAVLYNPRHYDALMQLGYANSESNPAMAIDYFNNALKSIPDSPEAMYNLGMLYQENGNPDKALNIYAEMLKINARNKLALYNSGYINLVYLTKYKEGYDFFSRALDVDSLYVDAWYNRGYSAELSGDYAKARHDYTKVLELKVNDAKAIKGLNRLDKIGKK